jgi:DNA-binding NarL/FixJ family response regulator
MGCAKIAIITPGNGREADYQTALSDKYDLAVITTAESALPLVKKEKPHAVIIDLGINHDDSINLVNQIKEIEDPGTMSIIVTADCEFDETLPDSFWGKNLEVDAFLSRPLLPARIRATVDEVFTKRVKPRNVVGPGFL